MKRPPLSWVLLPIIGTALALTFRLSEAQAITGKEVQPPAKPPRARLGNRIELVGILDNQGKLRFWMSRGELHSLKDAGKAGLSPADLSGLSFQEAEALCRRLSAETGRKVRLPTVAEWEEVARAGLKDPLYPWGWGKAPSGLQFGGKEPKGSGLKHASGLWNLSGGCWEWCAEGVAKGSAWSETDPATLKISCSMDFPDGYKAPDVGVRLLVEP